MSFFSRRLYRALDGHAAVRHDDAELKLAWLYDPGTHVVDPRAYGAVGDGVTDDTAALAAAMTVLNATAAGGILHLAPNTTYKTTGGLAITRDNIQVLGGGEGSVFKLIDTPAGALFTATGRAGLRFADFMVDGSALAEDTDTAVGVTRGMGMRLTSCARARFERLRFYKTTRCAIRGSFLSNTRIEGCSFEHINDQQTDRTINNGCPPVRLDHQDGLQVHHCRWNDCTTRNSVGLYVGQGTVSGDDSAALWNDLLVTDCSFDTLGLQDGTQGGGCAIVAIGLPRQSRPVRAIFAGLTFNKVADSHLWVQADDISISKIRSTASRFGGPLELQGSRITVDDVVATGVKSYGLWLHTDGWEGNDTNAVHATYFKGSNLHFEGGGNHGILLDNGSNVTLPGPTVAAWEAGAKLGPIALSHVTVDDFAQAGLAIKYPTGPLMLDDVQVTDVNTNVAADTTLTVQSGASTQITVASTTNFRAGGLSYVRFAADTTSYAIRSIDSATTMTLASVPGVFAIGARVFAPFAGQGGIEITGDDTLNPVKTTFNKVLLADRDGPNVTKGLYFSHLKGTVTIDPDTLLSLTGADYVSTASTALTDRRAHPAITASNVALAAEWGAGAVATVDANSTDDRGRITVTVAGGTPAGLAANPALTLTFARAFPRVPFVTTTREGGAANLGDVAANQGAFHVSTVVARTTTAVQFIYDTLPLAGTGYTFDYVMAW